MRLFIDEDLASRQLVGLLSKEGHDIVIPHDTGMLGESDVLQLTFAVQHGRVCLTRNGTDYKQLHDLVMASGGSHPGILTISSENDRRRDMKAGHILAAIRNLEAIVASTRNLILCLNEWR